MAVDVKIVGKKLHIEIDIDDPPKPSATGKTLVVSSTHDNIVTGATVQGKPLTLGLNAYIKA